MTIQFLKASLSSNLPLFSKILLSNYQALSKHVIQSFFSVSILISAEVKIYRRLDALGSKLANIMVEFLMSAFSSPPEQTKKRAAVRDEPLCTLYLIFGKIKRQSNAFDVTLPSLNLYLGIAIRAMHFSKLKTAFHLQKGIAYP